MAEMNRINSFKSFSEIKSVEKTNKLREENQAKRKQLSQKFESLLDELGITSYEGLDEETKKSLVSKLLGEEEIASNKEENVEEGNAFIFAAAKAKQEGKDSFDFNGKTYKVTLKKDTGLKESYNLLITEATRWQFGVIDKDGKIESTYVHHDGYPSAVVPEIKGMSASKAKKMLKDAEMGGMSSLGKFYNDSKESTTIKGEVKNIKKYLKEIAAEAGAEYVYLYDERIAKWVGADTYTDKALKPIDQIEESVVTEAKSWELGKDYPTYGVVVGIRQNGDLCEVSFDSGNKIVFRDNGGEWVQESVLKAKLDENTMQEIDKKVQKFVIKNANDYDYSNQDSAFQIYLSLKKLYPRLIKESVVNEAEKFKSTKDFLDFLEEIDGMPEHRIKRIMGKDYIDTPGGFRDEAEDYDNDIEEYTRSNMGSKEFEKLQDWWENNVAESVVTESHFKVGDKVKMSHGGTGVIVSLDKEDGADDEKYYNVELPSGEIHKHSPNELTKESVVNEEDITTDDQFKEYAMTVLKKAFGEDFDDAKAGEVVNGILKQADGDYGAAVGMLTSSLGESYITEAFDASYWEDYHEQSSKIENPGGMQLQQIVSGCVEDWNDNNEDGEDNEVTPTGEKKVLKLAKKFVKAKGWISDDVIDAMIAQES